MERLILVIVAAGLAWAGAQWSARLPYYDEARRAIPARTLVTVLLAAGGAAVAAWQSPFWLSAAFMSLWSVVFALVAVIDIETHYIPNGLIYPALAAALAAGFVDPRLHWLSVLLGAVLGFAFFFILYHLGGALYRGGLGWGDVTLATFVGAVTGLHPIIYALVAGMMISALTLLLLLGLRRITLRSYIPYGPYLCLGGWLGMLPAVLRFWGLA